MMNREAKANFSLQFISHTNGNTTYLDGIRMALEGGCRWIQLRMKGAADSEVEPIAVEAQKMCREAGATFVIDDRVEMVKRLGADGVHLGKNDMPISEARRILGDTFIIGGTANTIADVEDHWKSGADYVGCGPFRFTTTKEKPRKSATVSRSATFFLAAAFRFCALAGIAITRRSITTLMARREINVEVGLRCVIVNVMIVNSHGVDGVMCCCHSFYLVEI